MKFFHKFFRCQCLDVLFSVRRLDQGTFTKDTKHRKSNVNFYTVHEEVNYGFYNLLPRLRAVILRYGREYVSLRGESNNNKW